MVFSTTTLEVGFYDLIFAKLALITDPLNGRNSTDWILPSDSDEVLDSSTLFPVITLKTNLKSSKLGFDSNRDREGVILITVFSKFLLETQQLTDLVYNRINETIPNVDMDTITTSSEALKLNNNNIYFTNINVTCSVYGL